MAKKKDPKVAKTAFVKQRRGANVTNEIDEETARKVSGNEILEDPC